MWTVFFFFLIVLFPYFVEIENAKLPYYLFGTIIMATGLVVGNTFFIKKRHKLDPLKEERKSFDEELIKIYVSKSYLYTLSALVFVCMICLIMESLIPDYTPKLVNNHPFPLSRACLLALIGWILLFFEEAIESIWKMKR